MCGISGIHNFTAGEAADPGLLQAMLDSIVHRGPDDEGMHHEGPVAIGMRRLSIIDLGGGHQPIYNEDESIVVVFNGEIYNYRELADELKSNGHNLKTLSDTEVIVHLYEEYGDELVHHLRGMFAFAIWDRNRQRLLIARDRLGIKPLYYTDAGGRLRFGSEIKSLLRDPSIETDCDPIALSHYLSLKYVPAPLTMFKGIKSLPPGHLMVSDQDGLRTRQYWDWEFAEPEHGHASMPEQEATLRLEELLRESVKLRLRSDVPFGAFLSGGVDSSTIVALMSEFLSEPVKTFSVGFEMAAGQTDELPFARKVAQQFGTDHQEIIVGPQHFSDLAERVTWHLDQPLADQATLATLMLSELASRHVKMVLSGEGGDELFAGYARYAGDRWASSFGLMPGPLRKLAWAMGSRLPRMRRAKIGLYALCQSSESARMTNWFPLFNRDMKRQVLSSHWRDQLGTDMTEVLFGEHLERTNARESLNRMLYIDTKLWLPDLLLMRGDKMTMAHSLEARVPLLDHKVVEFAGSLPVHLKLRGSTRKYLLKQVARKLLPNEIIDRKKQGFPIPISAWFRTHARDFMRDLLAADTIRSRGWFNEVYVQKLIQEHESGYADHGPLLWGLMSVELWQRRVLDARQASQLVA